MGGGTKCHLNPPPCHLPNYYLPKEMLRNILPESFLGGGAKGPLPPSTPLPNQLSYHLFKKFWKQILPTKVAQKVKFF